MQGGERSHGSCQHPGRQQASLARQRGSGPGSGAGREFIDKHIKPMSEDLEKKRALFMDDASFISEVSSPLGSFSVIGSMPVCCQYSVLWGLR